MAPPISSSRSKHFLVSMVQDVSDNFHTWQKTYGIFFQSRFQMQFLEDFREQKQKATATATAVVGAKKCFVSLGTSLRINDALDLGILGTWTPTWTPIWTPPQEFSMSRA